jgi:hypothetical protein
MNIQDLGTQLLFTTAPIWVEKRDGSVMSGTAFFYGHRTEDGQNVPLLCTAWHVVADMKSAVVEFVGREGEGPKLKSRVRFGLDAAYLARFYATAPEVDLAFLPLAPILEQLERSGQPAFFRSASPEMVPTPEATEKLGAIEEVTIVGYPSGLRDEHNVLPIVRRGITATPPWIDYRGEPVFLVDAGIYPGSSGSPVFIYNEGTYHSGNSVIVGSRILLLGVIIRTHTRQEKEVNVYLGLGVAIRPVRFMQEVATFARRILGK